MFISACIFCIYVANIEHYMHCIQIYIFVTVHVRITVGIYICTMYITVHTLSTHGSVCTSMYAQANISKSIYCSVCNSIHQSFLLLNFYTVQ